MIFTNPEGQEFSENAMLAVLDRMGYGHVTVHSFRATFATWAEVLRRRIHNPVCFSAPWEYRPTFRTYVQFCDRGLTLHRISAAVLAAEVRRQL